ncbi:MAG: aminopeptidase P family protein [Acidimicrobiia bacterium]|nr:aminopeptidase P family protein [Acidimicrobiia bacterium]
MEYLEEIDQRQEEVRTALAGRGWGGGVVTSQQNFTYLTGLRFDALVSSAARSLACVVPVEGPLHLIVPEFVSGEVGEVLPDVVVTAYDPPREAIDETLGRIIAAIPKGPVGWETGPESRAGVTLGSADAVRAATGRDGIEDLSGLLWEIRMRKSPAEIAAIAKASRAGSLAFEATYANGIVGRSEREIARRLALSALENGAERVEWVASTSGAGSYHRFVSAPRERIVEPGDLFWADVGLTSGGYWTDFCRAATAGPVSGERASLQASVVEATAVGVARCRPGMRVSDVAAAIRRKMADLGVEGLDYGRLGHGIGLSSTEPPSIAEWDPTILAAGMVVTIEPAVSHPTGIYCAEQVVVVTDGEPVVLTTASSLLTPT